MAVAQPREPKLPARFVHGPTVRRVARRARRVHGHALGHACHSRGATRREPRRRHGRQRGIRHELLVRRLVRRGGGGLVRVPPLLTPPLTPTLTPTADPNQVAAERRAVLLRDGDTWVWKHGDDLRHKQGRVVKTPLRPGPPCQRPRQAPPRPRPLMHPPSPPTGLTPHCLPTRHGVWFPSRKPGQPRDGQRWAFMFRWSNGRKRAFDRAYPHRLQMTAEEEAHVAARRAAAAALTEKRKNPPASTHTMSKRARV